jgi:predicted ferric reductase
VESGQRHAQAQPGGKLLIVLLFWFGLATSVELWWLRTPVSSLGTTGDVLTAAGRVTGMVAGYCLLAQIGLASRVGWLERAVGAHDLVRWHRRLGAGLVFLVLAHLAFIVLGYAAVGRAAVFHQAWTMFTDYEDLDDAFLAAGILTLAGLLGIRAIRRAMPYEAWHWLHLSTYAIIVLGYAHQFSYGQELATGGFGRWYWIGLHALVIGAVVSGRVVSPLTLNRRHRLRVADVVPEAADSVSIYITGRRLDRLAARGGQHFRWRFLAPGCWWQAHPFSLSAAPNDRWLRLTVKAVGGHTHALRRLRPGVRVRIHGPGGVFTADRRRQARALLIAAGSGIAPVRALLEDLPPDTALIYRAGSERDLVLREELEWFAHHRGVPVWYVLGSRHDPGPRRLLHGAGLRELVPDVALRDAYLCGPPGFVDAAIDTLRRLGVPRRQIHLDPFEF